MSSLLISCFWFTVSVVSTFAPEQCYCRTQRLFQFFHSLQQPADFQPHLRGWEGKTGEVLCFVWGHTASKWLKQDASVRVLILGFVLTSSCGPRGWTLLKRKRHLPTRCGLLPAPERPAAFLLQVFTVVGEKVLWPIARVIWQSLRLQAVSPPADPHTLISLIPRHWAYSRHWEIILLD